jgi:hypothetical protein
MPDMTSEASCFALSPKQLRDEMRDAQAALAVAEHYISCCPQTLRHLSTYQSYATHEALHEAHKIIGRVIELLRAEAGRSPQRAPK